MTRRVIAMLVLATFLGMPLLAGCEAKHKDKKDASLKVDTEGSTKSIKVDTD